MSRWRAFVALLVLLSLFGCNGTQAGHTRQEAEQFIGSSLPEDAADVRVFGETGIDTIYYIRFDAAPDSVAGFTRSIGFTTNLREGYNPFPSKLASDISWWSVGSAQQYSGGSHTSGSGKVYELMVDTSNASAFRVYLRVYSV